METRLGPLRLANPIIGASGPFGFATGTPRGLSGAPLGAVVTASVAYRSRTGRPRAIAETAAGALLLPGEERVGVHRALRRHAREWPASPSPIVVSLCGDSAAEFAAAAAELEGVPGIVALEALVEDTQAAGEIVRAVRRTCALPLWVKLPPDDPDLTAAIAAVASAGATAATLGGGLHAATAMGEGQLVGPATFPLVLAVVAREAPSAPLPLIAGGGVAADAQARAYLRAGAAAVQVGSAQFADPGCAWRIAAALA